MARASQYLLGWRVRGRALFLGRPALTSFAVRAEQIAPLLGAVALPYDCLSRSAAESAPYVVWVADADPERMRLFPTGTPQYLDVINPRLHRGAPYFELAERFDRLLVNTEETMGYFPPRSDGTPWSFAVVPHHHCNERAWVLPTARVERPRVLGYIGEPEHLHHREALEEIATRLGLQLRVFPARQLGAYREIDLGVAFTTPDAFREHTRSNVKLANFAAHGIPSVVSPYASYRRMADQHGTLCLFAPTVRSVAEQLERLVEDEELRRRIHQTCLQAAPSYSRQAIAERTIEALNLRPATLR